MSETYHDRMKDKHWEAEDTGMAERLGIDDSFQPKEASMRDSSPFPLDPPLPRQETFSGDAPQKVTFLFRDLTYDIFKNLFAGILLTLLSTVEQEHKILTEITHYPLTECFANFVTVFE